MAGILTAQAASFYYWKQTGILNQNNFAYANAVGGKNEISINEILLKASKWYHSFHKVRADLFLIENVA